MPSIASRLQKQLRASRIALFSLTLPFIAAISMMDTIQPVLRVLYIVLGFSLIIFLHELGHFVVARLCSVKCLAFSIGIGPRFCGWRKGAGLTFGNDPYDPETLKEADRLRQLNEKTLEPQDQLKPALLKNVPAPHPHPSSSTHSDLPTTAYVAPHPRSIGDCDYRISYAPLGGYVRMLGQDDMDPTKVSTDPHAFNQRPIWQRMCIVSAGVVMNLIFAAVCFSIIFSPGIGVDFPPARLGVVYYDSQAWKAGLLPGDEILSINNEKHRGFLEFTDIQMNSALSTGTDNIIFEVKHAATGTTDFVPILPKRSEATGFLAIGVEAMIGVKVADDKANIEKAFAEMTKDGSKIPPAFAINKDELLKVRANDKIAAVDGIDIHDNYVTLYNHVQQLNGKPVKLTLVNTKNASLPPIEVTIAPHLEPLQGVKEFPPVLGLSPRLIVGALSKKFPAEKAGIKIEDRITRVGDRSFPSAEQLISIISSSNGLPVDFVIERSAADGKTETKSFKIAAKNDSGTYRIGVGPIQDTSSLSFIPPAKDTPAGTLNLPEDATISKIEGEAVTSWEDIYRLLRTKSPGEVTVTFKTPSTEIDQNLPFTKEQRDAVTSLLHFQLGMRLENETKTQVASNAAEAMLMGMDHTKKFILNVYMTLAGLARRTVDPSNLHGIVGITKIGYDVQERGPVWLWYVLAMVSVNLAVANFLPLPIVDGGLFLLLILEKIRGKPLSLKVQTAIQTVGIVLLASLFIFVTINDIGLFTK